MPAKKTTDPFVYSKPTMCLRCHLIVELSHHRDADPVKGAWQCPTPGCGYEYKFRHWKVKKKREKNEPPAVAAAKAENKKGATFLSNWPDALSQSENYRRNQK